MNLIVKVIQIKGQCPVYNEGASFILEDGYRLITDIPLCMHSLSSIIPYYNTLRFASPEDVGLAGIQQKEKAYLQCPDAQDHTGGGNVTFEISRSK